MRSGTLPSVNDFDTAYRRNQVRSVAFLLLLAAVLFGAFVLSLCSGSYDTPIGELLKGVFGMSADRKIGTSPML